MARQRPVSLALSAGAFLVFAALVTFMRLLPLQDYSTGTEVLDGTGFLGVPLALWPMPDILLCVTLAWTIRRPDLLPAPLIAGYFLIEDLLMLRPPGLWAAIVLLATEFLRGRNHMLRGFGFWLEYAVIAVMMVLMFLAYRLVLAIVMVPQVPLDLSLVHLLGTVLAYPAVVGVLHFVFKLRKPATGEVDMLGQKL